MSRSLFLLVIASYIDIKVGLDHRAAYIYWLDDTLFIKGGIRLEKMPFVHLSEPKGENLVKMTACET